MPLFVLPFPAIDPTAIAIGPFAIRWYALAYIAGILLGWWFVRLLAARVAGRGMGAVPSGVEIDDFVLWATLGIVLGGRLGYVIFYNPLHYLATPSEIVQLWKGGMAFHGGLAGVAVAMWAFSRKRAFGVLRLADLTAAAVPIGLFFGRIANFINGELWGRVSDVPWAMVFPYGGPAPRHPSQLYEAGLEGLVLLAVTAGLAFGTRILGRPGALTGVFVGGYGVARFIVEWFREPDAQLGYLLGGITMGQILSLPMVAIGAVLLIRALRRPPVAETP